MPTWANHQDTEGDSIVEQAISAWKHSMAEAEDTYKRFISMGMKPEEAREVLPNSTACRIIMRANVREWRHIFSLRCSTAAYPQMRELATMMLHQAHDAVPVAFDDLYDQYNENKGVSEE